MADAWSKLRRPYWNNLAGSGAQLKLRFDACTDFQRSIWPRNRSFYGSGRFPSVERYNGCKFAYGTPQNAIAFANLSRIQKNQYRWFVRTDRYQIENILYQQTLGILEYDPGPVVVGCQILRQYEIMFEAGLFGENPLGLGRSRRLISQVEEMKPEKQ